MTKPVSGDVWRYDYLWHWQHEAGETEGASPGLLRLPLLWQRKPAKPIFSYFQSLPCLRKEGWRWKFRKSNGAGLVLMTTSLSGSCWTNIITTCWKGHSILTRQPASAGSAKPFTKWPCARLSRSSERSRPRGCHAPTKASWCLSENSLLRPPNWRQKEKAASIAGRRFSVAGKFCFLLYPLAPRNWNLHHDHFRADFHALV